MINLVLQLLVTLQGLHADFFFLAEVKSIKIKEEQKLTATIRKDGSDHPFRKGATELRPN